MIPGSFYIDGNIYDVSAVRKGGLDGRRPDCEKIASWKDVYEMKSVEEPFAIKVELDAEDAEDAYRSVLKGAGASRKRDAVDKRIVKEVRRGRAAFCGSVTGLPGIIDSEDDVR